VLKSIPNKRLVLTWGDVADAADAARHSRVATHSQWADAKLSKLQITPVSGEHIRELVAELYRRPGAYHSDLRKMPSQLFRLRQKIFKDIAPLTQALMLKLPPDTVERWSASDCWLRF